MQSREKSASLEPDKGQGPVPFLRWAGGKRKLAETIVSTFPNTFNPIENNFFEPFVGGGAVTMHLGNKYQKTFVPGKNIFINDLNPDLVTTYKVVQQDPNKLMKKLDSISKRLDRDEFEKIRASKFNSPIDIAARFIYLNKTCFNGLWRVNSKGEFNVPWGKLKNPLIYNEDNIKLASERLFGATITNFNYPTVLENARKNDLVYLDPPYIPINQTSNFSKYAKEDFGPLDQYALAGVIDGLTAKGVKVILSNSDTAMTRKIFGDSLSLHQLLVTRSISAKSSSRIQVSELIGVNFNIPKSSLLNYLRVVS